MTRLHVAPRACSTCPYLRATPAGIWDSTEYEKLAAFDREPWEDDASLTTFHCHQENASGIPTVCKGWLVVHRESVAVRIAQAAGSLAPSDIPRSGDPCFYDSGNEARAAGLGGVMSPSSSARSEIEKLRRRGGAR